jgi:hypothetical protein
MLAPVSGLVFNPSDHTYWYQGKRLHYSVSQIADPLDDRSRAYVESKRHIWEPRGNTVHDALECFSKGQPVDAGKYGEWVDAMLEHWLLRDAEVIASEYSVCDPEHSIGGKFDSLIKTVKGTTALVDLKTVETRDAVRLRKPASCQLGGYLENLQRFHLLWVDRCVTFVVGPGLARVVPSDPDECVAEWQAARDCFLKARDF